MMRLSGRYVYTSLLCLLACTSAATPASAADAVVKVGFWNIRSGKGIAALPGRAAPYTDSNNCTDPSQPMNAWGAGAVQAQLTQAIGDPSVVAMGVAEAWFCGSVENIRKVLGWKAATRDQNGVALIARHGFAGPDQWLQLDTTLNTNPADTMWVVRAPVCLDAGCTQSMLVYAAHWYATGTSSATSYDRQALQTAQFLTATSGGQPLVLVGDLNVWEGTSSVCNQSPNNTALAALRNAGYRDAWTTTNGAAEGYTGMLNRAGCGYPEGYAWKRIDYAWTPASFPPLAMTRFGFVTPGDAAPSDHLGVVVTVPYPGSASAPPPPPPPPPPPVSSDTIVLHARNATIAGSAWSVVPDAAAAGGARVSNADLGAAKLTTAAAWPASYVELPFTAQTGRAYRLWIRGRAQNDSWQNDSTFVQFSGSLGADALPAFRIGTTSATVVSVEEGSGAGLAGWGWQDNGYGAPGPLIYFDTASQRIRLQVREDGLSIDQIVLSPVQFIATPPGAAKNDTTIFPQRTGTGTATGPTNTTTPVTWTQVVNALANGPELWKSRGCEGCPDAGAVSVQTVADAALAFTVSPSAWMCVGLGRDTSTNTQYAIDYAFCYNDSGGYEVRENAVYRADGRFVPSDVFKIAVSGTTVRYYRNTTLLYTSLIPVTTPLVVDTSLLSLAAGVTSAMIVK